MRADLGEVDGESCVGEEGKGEGSEASTIIPPCVPQIPPF